MLGDYMGMGWGSRCVEECAGTRWRGRAAGWQFVRGVRGYSFGIEVRLGKCGDTLRRAGVWVSWGLFVRGVHGYSCVNEVRLGMCGDTVSTESVPAFFFQISTCVFFVVFVLYSIHMILKPRYGSRLISD